MMEMSRCSSPFYAEDLVKVSIYTGFCKLGYTNWENVFEKYLSKKFFWYKINIAFPNESCLIMYNSENKSDFEKEKK